MKSFKDMFSEAKVAKGVNDGSPESGITKAKSEDELNFVKKHIATKQEHPVAPDDQFSGEIKGKKKKPRIADVTQDEAEKMYEMTESQKEKRDEIITSITSKINTSSFEEEVEIEEVEEEVEEISEGVINDLENIVKRKSMMAIKFKDGKKQKVDLTTASMVLSAYKQLNKANQKKVSGMMDDSKKFMQFVQFAMQAGK